MARNETPWDKYMREEGHLEYELHNYDFEPSLELDSEQLNQLKRVSPKCIIHGRLDADGNYIPHKDTQNDDFERSKRMKNILYSIEVRVEGEKIWQFIAARQTLIEAENFGANLRDHDNIRIRKFIHVQKAKKS